MAQPALDTRLRQRIEHTLTYALDEWADVPEYVQDWPELSIEQRIVLKLEWTIRDEALDELAAYAAEGLLSPEQQRRYVTLLALVARHRPTIERLFAGE